MDDITKRANWFDHQFLRPADFQVEQAYHRDRLRRHNQFLHKAGVADGFQVTGNIGDVAVTVGPGTAIDEDGYEIVLLSSRKVQLPAVSDTVAIYVKYGESPSDPSHDPGATGSTRVTEIPVLLTSRTSDPTPVGGVLLAVVKLENGTVEVEPDNDAKTLAGIASRALETYSLTLRRDGIDARKWPQLTAGEVQSGEYALLTVTGGAPTVLDETSEILRLVRPYPDLPAQNSAGLCVGPFFEAGFTGGTRLDIAVSGPPSVGNGMGVIPDVTVMSLLGKGNVGIGTTSPAFGRLMIKDGSVPLSFRETGCAVDKGGLWRMPLDGGVLRFDVNTGVAGQEFGETNYRTALSMNVDGNVGIGTMRPGAPLSIDGPSATVSIETTEMLRLTRPTVVGVKHSNSVGLFVGSFEEGVSGRTRLDLRLAGTPGDGNRWGEVPDVTVMTLDANGNVGIGIQPIAKLSVKVGDEGGSHFSVGISSTAWVTGQRGCIATSSDARGGAWSVGGEFTANREDSSEGDHSAYAVRGFAGHFAKIGRGTYYGVYGSAGGTGTNYGGYFEASGYGTNYGGYFKALSGSTNYAGWFEGDVRVTGSLQVGIKPFTIDHPIDPENMILRHYAVESPENLCLYRGKLKLDADGKGTVQMATYFAALTEEDAATVYVTPISEKPFPASYQWDNNYTALTIFGAASAEVAYLVLASRDDPVVHLLAQPVEEEKGAGNFEKGKLLYPEAYGYPRENAVGIEAERFRFGAFPAELLSDEPSTG